MPIRLFPLDTASAAYEEGDVIFRRGSVTLLSAGDTMLTFRVGTTPPQEVRLFPQGQALCSCGCENEPCAHMAAALLLAQQDGSFKRLTQAHALSVGTQMLAALSRAMPDQESVRLSALLRVYPDGRSALGLSLGQERMYAVKSIPELLACYTLGTSLTLSAKFTYQPTHMRFSKDDERLLSIISSHVSPKTDSFDASFSLSEGDTPRSAPQSDGRFIILSGAFLQSVLRYLETHPFMLMDADQKLPHSGIKTMELPLCFSVNLSVGELSVTAQGTEGLRLITPDGRYVLLDGRLIHLHSAQSRVCRLLTGEGFRFAFPAQNAEDILATLLPALSTVGTVLPSPELSARLITAPFKPKAYLDLVAGNVEARLSFCYGDVILHPFSAASASDTDEASSPSADPQGAAIPNGFLLLRDGRAESALLDFFSDAGFVVRGQRMVLRRAKDILLFCTQGVTELSQKCEVYASSDFEKIKPRRFAGRAAFHMRGGKLVFSLLEDAGEAAGILPILQAIRDRQQYVRLHTGEFLDIRDMAAFAPVAQELLDAASLDDPRADIEARELSFSAYRSAYMVTMLRMAGVKTNADSEVNQAVSALTGHAAEAEAFIPSKLLKKLASYQRRGAGWLLSLYEARMGGILADEMGLGKTVQVIAALSAAKKKNGVQKSIIISPTSLLYHWLAELKRFDDSLTVRMISGPKEDRERAIAELSQSDQIDVVLTSYPLFRRDAALLSAIPYRFAILDEAQFVKNSHSLGAVSAKELTAEVRLALTGTPMENHTGELWSIFDFVLPGYLGGQAAFLRRYGSGEHAEELRERIRPFLMRRLKSEVLTDLPQKHEQRLYAAMTPEQELVYRQLLSTLRQHVSTALKEDTLSRARMQVLSILLKLRQVCCHPKLFLPDYEGTSGKLELLVQTVHSATRSKRRLLIFSQFVGMLQIIRKRLSREGIKTLYLDGETKPELRQQLCDRFNGGEGQVFLISLKAGGTGLNLTGADLVIHYDPWWNPATEDQATDRAHRIGQTRDVDVFKLVAQDTIEEKVMDLSKRKRAIFDRVVLAGETALSGLTEEDIRALFF